MFVNHNWLVDSCIMCLVKLIDLINACEVKSILTWCEIWQWSWVGRIFWTFWFVTCDMVYSIFTFMLKNANIFMLVFALTTFEMIQKTIDSTNVLSPEYIINRWHVVVVCVVHITIICFMIVSKWGDLLKMMKPQHVNVFGLKYG
jgi:hypothetical protein